MARWLANWSVCLVVQLLTGLPPAWAMEQVPIGPRALGMGGAFTSIADDATAIFWNPAGLSLLERQEIGGTHARLYGSGTTDDCIAFVAPVWSGFSAAGDWYRSGFEDAELGFSENRFDLACGIRLRKWISVGANVKYLTRSVNLDESSVRESEGFGADWGLLVKPVPRVSLGVLGQDVFGTKLEYSGAGSSPAYGRSWRAGLSYTFPKLGVLAFDVDDRYHLGLEATPLEIIALRAGIEDDREGPERVIPSFGVGVRVGAFRFDYALVDHPFLGSTSHFGLSAAFHFNPAQVRIEKLEAAPIYLSLYRSYANEPFGSIRLRNLEDHAIQARVTVHMPDLMRVPSEQEVLIRPQSVQEFPLTAVFPDRVMDLDADRVVPLHVSVTYQSQRLLRTERRSARATAFAPGAVHWGAGVAPAAAFVTTKDPIIDSFAREAVRAVLFSAERERFGTDNIAFAAAIVDALGTLGMAYLPDPNQPYSSMPESPNAIDTVQYPRQTLERRTGDCDDSSVLLASLLSHVGVRCKLVDVPGHLFLLADAGVLARNRFSLSMDEDLYVLSDGDVWIPIETTALNLGFAEAWRRGAEQYVQRAAGGRLTLVDITETQARYKPAVPRGDLFATPSPDGTTLRSQLARDAGVIEAWRKDYRTSRFGEARLGSPDVSPDALNELAQVYFTTGKLGEARSRLEMMLKQDPASARAQNNLALTYLVEGDLARASRELEAALSSDDSDAGVWFNLGLTRDLAGDTLGAEAAFREGIPHAGGLARAAELLGVTAPPDATDQPLDARPPQRALLVAVREEVARRVARASDQELPERDLLGEGAGQRHSSLFSPTVRGAVRELLYWKE